MALLDLAGKHALVVGGGQGIGRATALALARAGSVRTPRIEAAWADGSVPRPDAGTFERMALPEDIAGPILFLVSDLARMVTGQSLVVDGGSTTKFPYALG